MKFIKVSKYTRELPADDDHREQEQEAERKAVMEKL